MKGNLIDVPILNIDEVMKSNVTTDEGSPEINEKESKESYDQSEIDNLTVRLKEELITDVKKKYNYKLPLNSYTVKLVSTILIGISALIFEWTVLLGITTKDTFTSKTASKEEFWEKLKGFIIYLFSRWIYVARLCSHFSIGFFCITTLSDVFKGTKKPFKFFMTNIILAILFYYMTAIIIFVVKNLIMDRAVEDLLNTAKTNYDIKNKINDTIGYFRNLASIQLINIIGSYNYFLDNLIIGSLYQFLFYKPINYSWKKFIIFRSCSLIPIIFIIISIIIRALSMTIKLKWSMYIVEIFAGPKLTVYAFLVTICLLIKKYAKKYNIFDENGEIDVNIFAGLGGKIFTIFCIIELICGLCFTELSIIGLGNNYLMILGVPIMFIFNYKANPSFSCKCCNFDHRRLSIILRIFIYVLIGTPFLVLFIDNYNSLKNLIKDIVKNGPEIIGKIETHYKNILSTLELIFMLIKNK